MLARYDKGVVDPKTYEITPFLLPAGPQQDPPRFLQSAEEVDAMLLGDWDAGGEEDGVCGMEEWDGPDPV